MESYEGQGQCPYCDDHDLIAAIPLPVSAAQPDLNRTESSWLIVKARVLREWRAFLDVLKQVIEQAQVDLHHRVFNKFVVSLMNRRRMPVTPQVRIISQYLHDENMWTLQTTRKISRSHRKGAASL
jgi:Trp operon repressor